MDLAYAGGGGRAGAQTTLVDPLLDVDMRFGLELQVALVGVPAIVAFKGALDVDRVRVVSFDQIAVIAVHRTHEIGEGCQKARRQGVPEAGALLRQVERKIGQRGPVR